MDSDWSFQYSPSQRFYARINLLKRSYSRKIEPSSIWTEWIRPYLHFRMTSAELEWPHLTTILHGLYTQLFLAMVNTLKSASRFGVLTTLAEDGKSPKSRASSRIDIERKSSCGHRNGITDISGTHIGLEWMKMFVEPWIKRASVYGW